MSGFDASDCPSHKANAELKFQLDHSMGADQQELVGERRPKLAKWFKLSVDHYSRRMPDKFQWSRELERKKENTSKVKPSTVDVRDFVRGGCPSQ